MRRTSWTSIPMMLLCSLGVAVALVYEYFKGHLSATELGSGFLLLIACLFGLSIFRMTRNETLSGEGTSDATLAVRRLRTIILTLAAVLVVASWITRNQPLLPRIVGGGINILLTCWFVFLLFRAKRNAKQVKRH